MPRKRMIDPSIWGSRSCTLLSSDRRKLGFICLFSNADDEGKGRVSDLADKFHMDGTELEEACLDYQNANLAHFFWAQEGLDRVFYYQLPKWFKYQVVNRPAPSYIPNHPHFSQIVPQNLQEKYKISTVEGVSLIPFGEDSVNQFTESIHGTDSVNGFSESIHGTDSVNPTKKTAEAVEGETVPPKTENLGPFTEEGQDLGKNDPEHVGGQGGGKNSLNPFTESIHAEVASLASTTPIKASSTTCTILNSKKRAKTARPLENKEKKQNLPLFSQIYAWWQDISHGKPLASSKKTEEQIATIRADIEKLAQAIGVDTMIDVAQITYRNKCNAKEDLPASLNYFLPMWKDIEKSKRKKRSTPPSRSEGSKQRRTSRPPREAKADPVHVAEALAGIKETLEKARGKGGASC